MKKIKLFIIACITFVTSIINVNAANVINTIDIDIVLDEQGTATITEVWNVSADSKTEFYFAREDIGNAQFKNFVVTDDTGAIYTFVNDWDVNGSYTDKIHKNGFHQIDNGVELCWGISKYGTRTYTLTYQVENYIVNTSDAQVLYWTLINDSTIPNNFTAKIQGPVTYEDALDVWGYGYKGYAYVKNGSIYLQNVENTSLNSDEYVVVLVKYPLGTFDTKNETSLFSTFDEALELAEEGSYDHDYNQKTLADYVTIILYFLFYLGLPIALIIFGIKQNKKQTGKYGVSNKKLDIKLIPNVRDIPNKNILRVNWIVYTYQINMIKTNFLGALLLKWQMEHRIEVIDDGETVFKKKKYAVRLKNSEGLNPQELEMYSILTTASKDGLLENNELEKWCKNNYNKFLKWFDDNLAAERDTLVAEGKIMPVTTGNVFKTTKYIIDDSIYDDAVKVAGVKKFLDEFSRINEKEAIEVALWEYYLIYAQMFGIADKVAAQFKKLYPEVINQSSYDFDNVIILSSFSHMAVVSASSARSAAQTYSDGGGGFSSGGGGGGSFGGGGHAGGGSR